MFIFIANLVYFMTIPKLMRVLICAKTFVHICITYLSFHIHTHIPRESYGKNLLIKTQVDNKLDLSCSLTLFSVYLRLYLCIIKLFITFSIIIFCLYFARFCETKKKVVMLINVRVCARNKVKKSTLITDIIMIHI